jgi:hypothetical protein
MKILTARGENSKSRMFTKNNIQLNSYQIEQTNITLKIFRLKIQNAFSVKTWDMTMPRGSLKTRQVPKHKKQLKLSLKHTKIR